MSYFLMIKKDLFKKFCKNDEIKKVLFSSKKEYFITSEKCFLKLDNDIKNWKKYDKIKKLSEICKIIINQGIQVG